MVQLDEHTEPMEPNLVSSSKSSKMESDGSFSFNFKETEQKNKVINKIFVIIKIFFH